MTVNYGATCDANAAKPGGWTKAAYPKCNRPSGHKPPHREYDPKTARLLRRASATERNRLYGQRR